MTLRECRIVIEAIVRVLGDSSRIEDIQTVGEITARRRLERILAKERARGGDLPEFVRRRPELSATIDLDKLRRLDPKTLGGAYARHLDTHGLEMYVGPPSARYLPDPDVRYLLHRYRQAHDIWHVLLELGTEGHEEVLVHAFSFGHLGLPNSALVVILGAMKHMVLERRWGVLRRELPAMFKLGQAAAPLLQAPWEELWDVPLDRVRQRYRLTRYGHLSSSNRDHRGQSDSHHPSP